ncbi:hypothetical protein PHMEG_00013753 [Phytophthora megakarya]|uniref:Uncharacterized protein n=1 Tax=Phytophthora megakarya TaxID=4795 RepID=A0A225W5H8_9STRA|nr:hypothetical protein PHMEG_00013753 [Phytophthora megakarya]
MSVPLRTPASSPVSASTVASTPAPVPASAPTSASVHASAPVSAATPTLLSGTTEKNFSVDKYFELQEKKLELEAKNRAGAATTDSPKTVFDGSSVLSNDGSIPLDYEEGEFEDEGTSSSPSYDSKPAAGIRRPPEDDSDASSSNHPEVLVMQCPPHWKHLPSPRFHLFFRPSNVMPRALTAQCANLGWRLRVLSQHGDDESKAKLLYLFFHERWYWSSKKTLGRSSVPEWQTLCQSWNQNVETFNKDSTAYRERITSARERSMRYSVTSVLQRVHEGSVNASIPCAVPVGINCPHCPPGAPCISERDLTGYTTNRVSENFKGLRAKLACTRQHPSVAPEHNPLRNTAPRSVTPPVHGGFRKPSPFPERPSSGRFGENTYLE